MKRIELKTEETYSQAFPGKSTSGYEWEAKLTGDTCILISKSFQSVSNGRMGENASEVFTIKALKSGRARIFFQLKRPWETQSIDAYELEVLIQD
ncbi:hypothetical protein BWI96_11630 [Siphonobacter sp. SORGH_AS_0500]|uniref:protease inhibitor I42 family protein n=1 Tax=Siphonobacter sp. SORGH_AS_0500 TaxID=1864824 RepID=UPI000CB062DC|nr:protease inhibitor I42 family protein [Siphonobacter sp. SORGH_AS_0500]PKK36499.1 hypothetical protein BWI96_11630 [Siphonobacter sp. SORGH_AS_0500]